MAALSALFAAVEKGTQEILTGLGQKIPNLHLGSAERFLKEALPRIVWVPLHGRTQPPRQVGGISSGRQLWQRELDIEVHVWAASIDAAEDLMNHHIAALDAERHGSYRVTGEAWDPTSQLASGILCILSLTVFLPFVDEPKPTAVITGASVTGTLLPAEDP